MQTKKRLAKGNLADILPSVECLWQHRWTSSVCRLIPFVTCSKASGVGRWNGSRSHCQLKTLQGAPFTTDCSSLVRQFRFFVFMILSYLSLCFCVLCFVFFFWKVLLTPNAQRTAGDPLGCRAGAADTDTDSEWTKLQNIPFYNA